MFKKHGRLDLETLLLLILILGYLFIMGLLVVPAHADGGRSAAGFTQDIYWNVPDNPSTPIREVRVYEKIGDEYVRVATVTSVGDGVVRLTDIAFGYHRWVVRFFDGWRESADSNVVSNFPALPVPQIRTTP